MCSSALQFDFGCLLCPKTEFDRQGPTNSTCMKGAPFSEEIDYHEKVFVVAEVDDTYVYHIHLGGTDAQTALLRVGRL